MSRHAIYEYDVAAAPGLVQHRPCAAPGLVQMPSGCPLQRIVGSLFHHLATVTARAAGSIVREVQRVSQQNQEPRQARQAMLMQRSRTKIKHRKRKNRKSAMMHL